MTGPAAVAMLDECVRARQKAESAAAHAKSATREARAARRAVERLARDLGAESLVEEVLELSRRLHSREMLIRAMSSELYGRRVAMQTVEDAR
jgi:hypothetical protein